MNPRAVSIARRRIRPSLQSLALQAPIQRRLASSNRQPSNVSQFYGTFTRPVAKVLLMAVFTYQLAYWGWVKLEHDEIQTEREAEIAGLEHEVARLTQSKPSAQQARAVLLSNGIDPESLSFEQFFALQRQSPEQQQRTVRIYAEDLQLQANGKVPTRPSDVKAPVDLDYEQKRRELERKIELIQAQEREGGEKKAGPWWKVW